MNGNRCRVGDDQIENQPGNMPGSGILRGEGRLGKPSHQIWESEHSWNRRILSIRLAAAIAGHSKPVLRSVARHDRMVSDEMWMHFRGMRLHEANWYRQRDHSAAEAPSSGMYSHVGGPLNANSRNVWSNSSPRRVKCCSIPFRHARGAFSSPDSS